VRQLGMEDLQGDGAVVPEIAGEIDRGHAATAELALEQAAVGQGNLEPFEGLGQRATSDWDISSLQPQSPPGQSHSDGYRFCYSFSGQKRAS
jgi:hypothetical protein